MYHEIMNEVAIMEAALKQLGERGKAYAHAEQDYKIALAKEMLILQTQGQKITIIRDLCYGTPTIARLRLNRDIAETMYKSAFEAINVKKIKYALWKHNMIVSIKVNERLR